MKKTTIKIALASAFCLALAASFVPAQKAAPENNPFAQGEKLVYLAHYGFINAGEATVSLSPNWHLVNGTNCYRVDVKAKAVGMFALTMHFNDTWQSYIDPVKIIPYKFYRSIEEGKYRKTETVYFDHAKQNARTEYITNQNPKVIKDFKIPQNVQDIVSSYYFLRTVDYQNKKKGDIILMDGVVDEDVYRLSVKFLGMETIKTEFGKINAYMLSPIMPKNGLFDGENSIKIWVSADGNRVPLKVKASMFVGSVELDLVKHSGLKQELKAVKK